jgi:hypothetical protein
MQVRTITRASFAVLLTASLSGQAPEDGGDQSSPRRGCADSPLG